jgi:hypothetical protein
MAFAIFYIDDFDSKTAIAIHPITNRRINVCIKKNSNFINKIEFVNRLIYGHEKYILHMKMELILMHH